MDTVNDALTLLRARFLHAIGIMAQLMLVDAGGTADGCKRKIGLIGSEDSSCIQKMVFKFIVSVDEPLRYIVAIGNHAFHMELQ